MWKLTDKNRNVRKDCAAILNIPEEFYRVFYEKETGLSSASRISKIQNVRSEDNS